MQEHAAQETAKEEMADQELAVQFKSNLWQRFPTDYDELLLICKKSLIGVRSRHLGKSLAIKVKAAHSTPLDRVHYIVGR